MRDTLLQMRKWAVGSLVRDCCKNECGASMIEYSLLIGLISAIVIGAVSIARNIVAQRWQVLVDVIAVVAW